MKTRKLNKMGKIAIIASIFIIIGIIIIFILWKQNSKEEINIIEQSENYTLKIDYPIVGIKSIDDSLTEFVETQKKEFFESIKDLERSTDQKFDFNIQYQINGIENIKSIHVILYTYSGGNHYMRLDKTYHYNDQTKEEVNLNYFLENDKSLSKLSALANYYVMKFSKDNNKNFLESMVNDGTKAEIENYNHFVFKEAGLQILFPPYQVASWADGEVTILIPYNELEGIIKAEYRNKISEEEVPTTKPEKRDLEQFKDKKLIAFTFDDGPSSKSTSYLLDNLDKYNARVTFFVLGNRVDQNKEIIKRAYLQGNQIGSHTYNHRNLLKLDNNSILDEIKSTNDAIYEAIGYTPTLLRPPYGNTSSDIKGISNMYTILWNDDTLDWKYKDKNKIADEIVKSAKDGNIVLLHDIYQSSVDGALLAMERLQNEGYAFVTVEEIVTIKGITLDITKDYFNF